MLVSLCSIVEFFPPSSRATNLVKSVPTDSRIFFPTGTEPVQAEMDMDSSTEES